MIDKIENIEDVTVFFTQLYNEGVSAHPDDDFYDYINYETKEPSFNLEDVNLRNRLMNDSFEVCERADVDIYDLMVNVYNNKIDAD
jgi:hypothetical protein